jgi:hypothetical protein
MRCAQAEGHLSQDRRRNARYLGVYGLWACADRRTDAGPLRADDVLQHRTIGIRALSIAPRLAMPVTVGPMIAMESTRDLPGLVPRPTPKPTAFPLRVAATQPRECHVGDPQSGTSR